MIPVDTELKIRGKHMTSIEIILNTVFFKIWNMSIRAGYCILAVLLLRFLLQKFPRKYLYMLWLVVAFRLVCPVTLNTQFSLFNLEVLTDYGGVLAERPEEDQKSQEKTMEAGAESASLEQSPKKPEEESTAVSLGEMMQRPKSIRTSLREFLHLAGKGQRKETSLWRMGTCVWIAGMGVFAVYFAVGIVRMRNRVRWAVRRKSGRKDQDRIYECDSLSSPFVAGLFSPRIYLPWGLPEEQREMVLLHERVHIQRKDHLVKYLSFALLAVYWFHPLVWAAWAGMCRDMEMSCDEKVLELLGGGRRKEYSRALLALAAEQPMSGRMPLAFGEQDVKKRIRHVLDFRKPALWVGAAAMAVLLGVLVLLGTNGIKRTEEPEIFDGQEVWEYAAALYEARNPYVGDVSANGRLLGVIGEAYPELLISKTPFKTELQTSKEPYEFCFRMETEPPKSDLERELVELDMNVTAALMLALTDNLGRVRWSYRSPEGEELSQGGSINAAEAAKWCGAENIKQFAESEEQIQCLLDRIEGLYVRVWDSDDPFMTWYADLPVRLYEQAVPIDAASYEMREETDPCMFILAETEDQAVTIYGCSSKRLGDRGLTLVLRALHQEESQYVFIDEKYWGGKLTESHTNVYMEDTNRDGKEEIILQRQNSEGEIRRTIFGFGADGRLETLEESEAEQISEEPKEIQGE